MQIDAITKIDKASLEGITFSKDEVLNGIDEIAIRQQDLTRAMALGNLYKETVRIQFENAEGEPMETEATIWSVTEKRVILKSGVSIPIHSIMSASI